MWREAQMFESFVDCRNNKVLHFISAVAKLGMRVEIIEVCTINYLFEINHFI